METGISHVYELTGSKAGITLQVTLTEEYDVLGNFSDLSVAVGVKSSQYKYTYYLSGSLKVNGQKLVSFNSSTPTHYVTTRSLNSYYRIRGQSDSYAGSPWSLKGVEHEADGSKSVTVEVDITGYTSGGGGSGWRVEDSREISLTHIPRASTIGAADACIGAVSTVSVVRRSADYTHSVAYAFGGLSGYLDADGSLRDTEALLTASSIPFTIPESFYAQIPDAPSAVCTLTCRTYRDGAQLGDAQTCAFTVTAKKELCIPQITATVTDGNPVTLALTGDGNKLVRFGSTAVCTIAAEAKNGASIAGKTIAGVPVEGDTLTVEAVESGKISFAVTDSRGYTNAVEVERELIPYTRLTANLSVKRTNPTNGKALLTVTGNCYSGSFGAAENTLQILCYVDGGQAILLTPVLGENAYTLTTELTGLDYLHAHTVEVEVRDCVTQVVRTATVGKGIPVFDWGEEDFIFHVPVGMDGNKLGGIAAPTEDGDSANKAYVDASALQTVNTARQAGKTMLQENMAVSLLSNESLSGTTMVTAYGGWSAGYRLYMILMTMADEDTPMVQLLIPREQVGSGQIFSVSTAASSKKLRVYHDGENLTVETVGYTGNGGGSTAYIYGLFPEQTLEEEE